MGNPRGCPENPGSSVSQDSSGCPKNSGSSANMKDDSYLTTTKLAGAKTLTTPCKQQRTPSLLFFVGCICCFELFYLLLFALSPFPGLHLSSTPIGEAWPWTFWPAQVLTGIVSPLMNVSSHHERLSPILLGVTLIGLLGIYALAIIMLCGRYNTERVNTRFYLFLLLTGTLIFCITLLFQPLLLSDDVFSYIFSGRILAVYGADPLNTAPIQFPFDPYLRWVLSGRASPNIFGPLWLCIATLLAAISSKPVITLLLFKGLAILSHLLNSLLIWGILSRIAPRRRLLGTLLYSWNPLAVIELAGSSHNEGVLLTLLLSATLLYVCQLPGPEHKKPGGLSLFSPLLLKCCSFIIFGLAIGMNLITLLIAPLLLWFDVRSEQNMSSALWKIGGFTLLMLIPALAVSLPFWRGASTFLAITSAIDMQHFVYSPISLLANPLHRLFGFVASTLGFPLFEQPAVAADVTLRASATFIFVLIYVHLFGQVRNAPVTLTEAANRLYNDKDMIVPGLDTLLGCWGIAIFCYMVLVSGWFWPWYLLWLLWVVVVQRLNIFTSAMLVLSGTALFIYPFIGFSTGPMATHQAALIFGIPLLYLIAGWIRQHSVDWLRLRQDP
jgi:hypothetical protein